MSPEAIVDREYLELRSKVLQIGASLDRIERAGGNLAKNTKASLLLETIRILLDGKPERTERIQLACSRPYDVGWMK